MQSYPIWHDVKACHYKSSKSYGGKNNSGETIYVGTSRKNSHYHCKILTTRREIDDVEFGECYVFKTSINDIIIKETYVSIKDKKMVREVFNKPLIYCINQ